MPKKLRNIAQIGVYNHYTNAARMYNDLIEYKRRYLTLQFAKDAEQMLSPAGFACEFKTGILNLGRRCGTTTFIENYVNNDPNSLVITFKSIVARNLNVPVRQRHAISAWANGRRPYAGANQSFSVVFLDVYSYQQMVDSAAIDEMYIDIGKHTDIFIGLG